MPYIPAECVSTKYNVKECILQELFWKRSSALMVASESEHSIFNPKFGENFTNKFSSLQSASSSVETTLLIQQWAALLYLFRNTQTLLFHFLIH